jgi:hypothetical protein
VFEKGKFSIVFGF